MGGNIPGENFLGGNFPGEDFPEGRLMGWNFPGGNFPGGNFLEPYNNYTLRLCRSSLVEWEAILLMWFI